MHGSEPRPIGIIGVGEIAAAIVDGLSQARRPAQILLSPRGAVTAARLAREHGNVTVCADNQAVVDGAELVLLCVPPASVEQTLTPLRVPGDRTVVSAASGWPVASLHALLPGHPAIVRVVPLPAVRQRRGITAVFPSNPAVEELFGPLGEVAVADDEASFDALAATTATISTHLAYLTAITGGLSERGVEPATAERFVRAMFRGVDASPADAARALASLAAAHETPAGTNEQFRTRWLDEVNRKQLADELDQILARLTGTQARVDRPKLS